MATLFFPMVLNGEVEETVIQGSSKGLKPQEAQFATKIIHTFKHGGARQRRARVDCVCVS
jgi:hypothetical protein